MLRLWNIKSKISLYYISFFILIIHKSIHTNVDLTHINLKLLLNELISTLILNSSFITLFTHKFLFELFKLWY